MSEVKPWQIVLIVAAVAAVAISAYMALAGEGPPKLVDAVTVVDVTTGDLYSLVLPPPPKAIVYPVRNPDTGKLALLPVSKNAAGAWAIVSRDLGALAMVEGEPKALKDRKSGQVTVTSDTPKRIK